MFKTYDLGGENKKMKKMKLIGIAAIAMALIIAFSGVPVASRPACTTPETQTINTVIQMSSRGMVTETEKVSWESSNEDLLNSPPLQDREVIGRISYKDSLKVTNGETRFAKVTGLDTGDTPNFDVMKSVGYDQAGTIGSLSLDENLRMGIVANFVNSSDVALCPALAATTNNTVPASYEDVSASSRMVVTDVLATTRSIVGITDVPVSLHYAVTATGLGGAGTRAHGSIATEFSAYALEGSAENGNASEHTLGSELTYYKRSTAIGSWEINAEMDYTSRIRP